LSKSDGIIKMLSQTLFPVVVDVDGDGVDEIFFDDVAFD
jgi:hypothetical protein